MINLGHYDGKSLAGTIANTPLSTTTFAEGTKVKKYLRYVADMCNNHHDDLSVIKEVTLSDNSKLKKLGVDAIECSDSFEYRPAAPVGKQLQKSRMGKWITFLKDETLGWDVLGSFSISDKEGIKKFYKVLADIKKMKLPLDFKTIEYLMKLVR